MRVGHSPGKNLSSAYSPARVTVCLLVCIPHRIGYYAHRFDVLKLCLESIVRHTDAPHDLLVFDNGSCPEVVDYLQSLRDRGAIRFLLLSAVNIGAAGAYKIMFNAAPGEVIAYSDDDILFYPGWLQACLEILDSFPRVGMVSGVPVRHQFRYGNRYLATYLSDFPSVAAESGHFIPDSWERDFFASVSAGTEVENTRRRIREAYQDVVLEYKSVKAYSTATHFQFVAPKAVILQGLKAEWEPGLMVGDQEMDERIDALGYARLSTFERYVRHIGNVITPDLSDAISELGLSGISKVWTPPPRLLVKLAQQKVVRGLLKRLYNWYYFLSRYTPLG